MEIKINIGIEQILYAIRQLPGNQIARIKTELNKSFTQKAKPQQASALQEFLLQAPVMSEEQYLSFSDNRKQLKQWRTK